ncbi:ATP-binding protein [Methylomagnum sp.]
MADSILFIADDDQAGRWIKDAGLGQLGVRVLWAATAESALRFSTQRGPLLALLAKTPPDMALTEICQAIKAADDALPILYIAPPGAGFQIGPDIHLHEPLAPEELAATVALCVRLRRREAAARHAEADEQRCRFQSRLLDAVEQAIIVSDLEWRIIYWNRFAEKVYGWAGPEVMGRDAIELILPETADSQRAELLASLMTGRPITGEFMVRHRDGHSFPVLATNSPVYDDQGRLAYVICVSMDITARKQAEETLRELNHDLSLADRRKDEFLAMLSHELRNPLAPIRNAVRLLREPGQAETRQAWARDVIDRQVGHLARLLDDLLDVSRLTQGKIVLRKAAVDIAVAVEHALEVSGHLIQSHCHELDVHLPTESLWVLADPTRLAQILGNLLTNAAKYTPPGGRIRLGVERDADYAAIRVRDTGVGIPADLLPRIFDLFTQVEPNLERRQGGLGVGLTIVKKLVEMHDGEILAQSGGQGSEFTVRLPLAVDSPAATPSGATVGNFRAPRAGRRILVVEDNEDALQSLTMLLELDGHRVCAAANGSAALELARGFCPEVALLDIGLPDMDGYELARRLREGSEHHPLLLVAISGHAQEAHRRRAESAGFDHLLVKPVDSDELTWLLAERP